MQSLLTEVTPLSLETRQFIIEYLQGGWVDYHCCYKLRVRSSNICEGPLKFTDAERQHLLSCAYIKTKQDILAIGTQSNQIKLWDISSSSTLSHTLDGHRGPVSALEPLTRTANAQTGRQVCLASGSWDAAVCIWDLPNIMNTHSAVATSAQPVLRLSGHTGSISALSVAIGSDKLFSCSYNGIAHFWDLKTGTTTTQLTPSEKKKVRSFSCMKVLNTSDVVVLGGVPRQITLWDPRANAESSQSIAVQRGTVTALEVLSEYKIAAGGSDGLLRIYDVRKAAKNDTAAKNDKAAKYDKGAWKSFRLHAAAISGLTLVAEGSSRRLVSCSWDKTVRITDLRKGKILKVLTDHTNRVSSVVALPDLTLLSCSWDSTVRVWDASPKK